MTAIRKKNALVAGVEADLLRRVRAAGGMSKVELARAMRLAPSTVGIYVERLRADGLLRRRGKGVRQAGRPPDMLELDPAGGRFVGVDFEAHDIMAVAVDFAQQTGQRVQRRMAEPDTAAHVLDEVEAAVAEAAGSARDDLLAIGVGAPGIVDAERGVVLRYGHIRDWRDVPVAARLCERFGKPVFVENNVRAMAYGEMWFGQGRGVRDFVCLGVRTGVAAGLVIGGRLCRGSANFAGEIGRWRCPSLPAGSGPNGAPGAPAVQELEQVASVGAILGEAGHPTLTEALEAAAAGEVATQRALDRAAAALGWTVAQLTPCLNPAKVILCGPLAVAGAGFLTRMREAARQALERSGLDAPAIVASELGEFAGAIGAAALAVHRWQPAR